MTNATVTTETVRRLLTSTLDDPVLVMRAGKTEVVDAGARSPGDQGALFIASRRALLDQTDVSPDDEAELRRLAVTLSQLADRLGA